MEPEEEEPARLRPGLTRPVPRPSGASAMQAEPGGASNGRNPEGEAEPDQRLPAEFARYKADVKSRGKPFYP